MRLRDIYARAGEMVRAFYAGLGLQESEYPLRLKTLPHAGDLDRWPVTIHPQGEGQPWTVTYGMGGSGEWGDFEARAKSATMAALCAHPNLKKLSRESGVQYATLWRAKDGRAVTKRIIELMGQVPDVVFIGPDGVIEEGAPIPALTLDQVRSVLAG